MGLLDDDGGDSLPLRKESGECRVPLDNLNGRTSHNIGDDLIPTRYQDAFKMKSVRTSHNTVVCILTVQVFIIILFALFVDYHENAKRNPTSDNLDSYYPLFQDIHVMMFIGFGFLMTFLKKYAFSATGLTMLVAALIIQWAILCHGFFSMEGGKISVDITSLIHADIVSAAVLISFGAVLGKISPLQLIIMGIIETVLCCANEYVGTEYLLAIDAGGSMFIHVFGAYFGLAVSIVLCKGVKFSKKDEELEGSSYNSDVFAMIGTIFLWLFWPSFNGGLIEGAARHRAIINTYLSISASAVTTYAISAFFNKSHKFDMVHIQNATLAGGVCIGTAADLMVHPYGALIIGTFAGCLSTIGYQFLQGILNRAIGLHDTCGVNNLHGMPGLAAGFIGALMAALANEESYGYGLYDTFPARSPMNNSMAYETLSAQYSVAPGEGRTATLQAGYQLIALLLTFVVAIIGGLITGRIIKLPLFDPVRNGSFFDDEAFWNVHEENKDVVCLDAEENAQVRS